MKPLLEASASEWDRIHTVNVRGAFLMTREAARVMVAAGMGGRIVNIGSNSLRGGIVRGLAAYASSKGAINALSLASAFELAEHNITVNTVLPGAESTPGASTPPDRSPPARYAANAFRPARRARDRGGGAVLRVTGGGGR